MNRPINYISLFSGIGGFELGMGKESNLKRKCEGCMAYEYDFGGGRCLLGYDTESVYVGTLDNIKCYNLKPAEECPKPRTNKEYVEISLRQSRGDSR